MLAVCAVVPVQADWSDNFDSYQLGSQMIGQGGWEGWYLDPNAGALVSNDFALSAPHSVKCELTSDLVHPNLGATAGQWVLTAWHYVTAVPPSATYFIANNEYSGQNQTAQWSIELQFTSGGKVVDDFRPSNDVNLVPGQWVKLHFCIDLDANTMDSYYNDTLVSTGVYAIRGGAVALVNIDLYSAGPVEYFDDISLTEGGCGGQPCGENAELNAKCKGGGKKVIGSLKKADPDTEVTFAVDGGDEQVKTTNRKGKAKAKWSGLAEGGHQVTVCDLSDDC
jgi:hypothetical protein